MRAQWPQTEVLSGTSDEGLITTSLSMLFLIIILFGFLLNLTMKVSNLEELCDPEKIHN